MKKKPTCSWREIGQIKTLEVVRIKGLFWTVLTATAIGSHHREFYMLHVDYRSYQLPNKPKIIGLTISGHVKSKILRRNS